MNTPRLLREADEKEKKGVWDYLHYYLGCECHVDAGQFPEQTLPILGSMGNKALLGRRSISIVEVKDCKPILRPLSDMTEDEWREFFNLDGTATITRKYDRGNHIEWEYKCIHPNKDRNNDDGFSYSAVAIGKEPKCTPEKLHYLLSKHFDLFGLIESGLAIDKTKANYK